MINLLVLVCLLLNSVIADNSEECNMGIGDMKYIGKELERPKECDQNNICILKCCEFNQVLFMNINNITECTEESDINKIVKIEYKPIEIFNLIDNNTQIVNSKNKKYSDFHKFYNKNFVEEKCSNSLKKINLTGSILEDGKMVMSKDGQIIVLYEPLQYCMDKLVSHNHEDNTYYTETSFFFMKVPASTCDAFVRITLIISIVFLILTITVQCVLGQVHKMVDKLNLTYIVMLLLGSTFRTVILFVLSSEQLLIGYNVVIPICSIFFFFQISSFFWLNIASLDIWWSLRGIRLQHQIHHRGIWSKYRRYGLYAWGMPLILTIVYNIIDSYGSDDIIKPEFATCFFGEQKNLLYMYVPLCTICVMNCVLFVMTVYNIWLVQNAPEIRNVSSTIMQKNRFTKFIKLSTMMGVSWVAEAVQALYKSECNALFYILNTYIGCIGIIVFFTFAFNMSNYKQFCKKFNIKSKYNVARQESTLTSYNTSQKSNSIMLLRTDKNNEFTADQSPRTTGSLIQDSP